MKSDVNANKLVNAARFNLRTTAPTAIGTDDLAELRTPVAEVIDTNTGIAEEFMKLFQRVTNHCCAEMTDMEGLGNVRGGIVEHHGFALTALGRAVKVAVSTDIGQHARSERRTVHTEIEIAVDCRNLREKRRRKAFCQRVRDLDGRGAERAAELEAGQGQIAHRGIGRIFKHGIDLFCLQCSCGERGGNRIRDQGGGLGFEF